MLQRENWVFSVGGCKCTDEIEVRSLAAVGIHQSNSSNDIEAPIASLGHIIFVSKFLHEFVTSLCVLRQSKTSTWNPLTEAIIWQ